MQFGWTRQNRIYALPPIPGRRCGWRNRIETTARFLISNHLLKWLLSGRSIISATALLNLRLAGIRPLEGGPIVRQRKETIDKQAVPSGRPNKSESQTVAERAQHLAERVYNITDQVVASFKFSDVIQRQLFVQEITTEIYFDMLPVFGWIERNRSPAIAQTTHYRVGAVLEEAFQIAGLEIPEYAGGEIATVSGDCSPGMTRTATLAVFAMATGVFLQDWAKEIQRDEDNLDGPEHSIHAVGDQWEIRFGSERGQYRHKCIGWLREILSRPRRTLTVADLLGDPDGKLAGDARMHGEQEADLQAIREIRDRLEDIDETISATGGSEELHEEKAELLQKVKSASTRIPSALRKSHHNIASQIRTFARKLETEMPLLSAHLKSSLSVNLPHFGYFPNPLIDWKI